MKYFKIKYSNGQFKIVNGMDSLEIIKRYDLATKEHLNTRVIELSGEQEAIAIDNDNDRFIEQAIKDHKDLYYEHHIK